MYKGKTTAKIGDIILVSVKTYNPGSSNTNIKKGSKFKALVIRSKYSFTRKSTGMSINFNDNAVVLIDSNRKLIGNRVFGETIREIREILPEVTNLILKVY